MPSLLGDRPNHIDSNYMELPRVAFRARGVLLLMGLLLLAWVGVLVAGPISFLDVNDVSVFTVALASNLVCLWTALVVIRLDVSPPRDLPLRFNRSRQRIYAYNFKYQWWNPFGRWRVVPVAYDWSQVRAERWKKRGATSHGAIIFKWGVVLSIVKPGTNDVIDRFPLTTMGGDEFAWAYVCTYMQGGLNALPEGDIPRDQDELPSYNPASLLAPKVKWPADMDRESRTAP